MATESPILPRIHLVLWIVLALAIPRALFLLFEGANFLFLPYETTKPESFILNGAWRIAQGLPLYPQFGKLPFIVHVYNPLTYFPAGIAGRLFDLEMPAIRLVGRTISFVSTALLAALFATWLWKQTANWKCGLLAALALYYFHSPTLSDFFRLRPELPGLLFTFAGVIVFLSTFRRRIPIAATLFLTAFFFKQSFVIAPLSVFAFLILQRQHKTAFLFAAYMTAALSLFLGWMFLTTGANYFDNTVIALATNEIHPIRELIDFAPQLFKPMWGLILAAPIALVALTIRKEHAFLVLYFGLCLLWTLYSAGKYGAGIGYYSELTVLSILVVALSIGGLEKRVGFLSTTILALLSLQVVTGICREGVYGQPTPHGEYNIASHVERYKSTPGEKLICHDMMAIHSDQVEAIDWLLLDHLSQRNVIDVEPLLQNVVDGKYSLIVVALPPYRCTPLEDRVIEAIEQGPYQATPTYNDNLVVEIARKKSFATNGPP